MTQQQIAEECYAMRRENRKAQEKLKDACCLTDYRDLTTEKDGCRIWTGALQTALEEHEIVRIPASDSPYWIDSSVRVPSNRRIEAEPEAIVKQMPGVRVLMLRNTHPHDGTHGPVDSSDRDENIMITGGIWAESWTGRKGYGRSGQFDEEYSWKGVSTCMYFGNIRGLTIRNVTFRNTAGFSVQVGDADDVDMEDIRFESCFADGLHINGNCHRVLAEDIRGQVGDDLVALNMYDWQNSSVNFGPTDCVLCDGLTLSDDSRYKALRIEPGVYTYADGSKVDCALTNAVIRKVRGIMTFKVYFQTPAYRIGTEPEPGAVGSGDNLYFEDIDIDLAGPIDGFAAYTESEPVRGHFGAFEFGANIGRVELRNIRLTTHREKYPLSHLAVCGPKSVLSGDRQYEIFDPYLSSTVDTLILDDIAIDGVKITEAGDWVRVTSFDDVNQDGHSTGCGQIRRIDTVQKKEEM